jgi:hypothetical protein
MIFVFELTMAIVGLVGLVTGRLRFTSNVRATGTAARIASLFLLLPFPLMFGTFFVSGFIVGVKGLDAPPDLEWTEIIASIPILGFCFLESFLIAKVWGAASDELPPRPAESAAKEVSTRLSSEEIVEEATLVEDSPQEIQTSPRPGFAIPATVASPAPVNVSNGRRTPRSLLPFVCYAEIPVVLLVAMGLTVFHVVSGAVEPGAELAAPTPVPVWMGNFFPQTPFGPPRAPGFVPVPQRGPTFTPQPPRAPNRPMPPQPVRRGR